VTVLGGASVFQTVQAQRLKRPPRRPLIDEKAPEKGPGAVKKESYDLGNLTLPKNDDLKDRIDSARDNIINASRAERRGEKKVADDYWERACKTLQELVGREQDEWVPLSGTDATGREIQRYGSVKKEALRLIGTLPKEGRSYYQATYGPKAETMVKRARENSDEREMGKALSLYLYTDAGADAANWLGTWMLDRADFVGATRYFLQLINRAGIKEVKNHRALVKAALAFHHQGDEVKAYKDQVFKELEARGIEIKFRAEPRTVAELQDTINKMVTRVSLQSASDSPIFRGRPNRNATLPGGPPFMEPVWKQKSVRTDATTQQLRTAETALQTRNLPILSTFFPVTATVTKGEKKIPLLIYRSYWGVHAVNMKSGKLEWDSPSDWSIDRVLGAVGRDRDSNKVTAYSTWLGHFLASTVRPQIIFENSVLGTLSADSKMVYAVEDLAVPPPQHMTVSDPRFGTNWNWGPQVSAAINHNKLQAFELGTGGKLKWELGGRDDKLPLSDTYFLGPPLPVNGRLYVLTEKQQELGLVAIDPATGKVLGKQTLANTKDLKLSQDPLRRTQAAHLSYGEGILVVPTNAGAVFGIDLLSNSLVWAYPYREAGTGPATPAIPRWGVPPPGWIRLPNGMIIPASSNEVHWQVTAPVVQNGKVVFTAPDAKGIHCISLRDGTRLWTQPRRDDDMFLAGVFDGKAVIVGRSRTRAISLARGDVVWELETGLPSGQGAAASPNAAGEIIYYLPVREAINTREPEICAINVNRGLIHAHTRSRKREVPGNLIFYEGSVLSQTHTEVVAYPQLEIKLAEMDKLVKANPKDPVALTERGDYLLDKGDLPGAIADFRGALANKTKDTPETTLVKARTKLYEAFTEYFQKDFNKAEDFLKEYEEICKIDLTNLVGAERTAAQAEMRRRRANFLCLVGKGREAQNRLVDAFEKYLELGAEARKDELIQVVDEPSVKAAPDVWSQGRIAAMVANAKDAKQKKALEDLITARWKKLKESKPMPLDGLRKFVALFGSLFGVGKEARLALAERLMEDNDVNSLLEAEQQLSLLRGEQEAPEVAARAVEALARLNTRKGLLEDAAFYYRLLGEKYPKVVVDGKKGEEYLEDLATDKRFLPYLDQAGRFVIRGKVDLRHTEKRENFPYSVQTYQFAHAGEAVPFFVRNKLALQMTYPQQLKLHDTSSGEDRWKLNLTPTQFQQIATNNGQPHRVKFSYQTLGHVIVLQLGHMVFGVDPLNKGRVLWEKNLSSLPGSATTPPYYQSLSVDPKDGAVVVLYSDGWMQRLGETGPLQGGVICLQMRDSLTAIDPVSGRTLWTRSDVNSRCHIFGDEQHIYVVGMGASGGATGSRVFRAYDGVSVRVPEFSNHYEQRVRMIGRNILASSLDGKGGLTLRIYDVLAGKDLWRQSFAPGAVLMQSEDPRLAGVAEPSTGAIHVIDVQTQKEVLSTKVVDTKHLDKAQSIALVSDPDSVYVAVNGPVDPNLVPWGGGVQSNLMSGGGLRSVPVNGMVYSFNRKSGKYAWYVPMANQHLVVSQFEDLPMLLFTSRYQEWVGQLPARSQVQKTVCRAIAKHNGKMWYDNDNVPMNMAFHALEMDHRTGKVDFTGYQLKVTMTAVPK
jgi:outer membrane protein assembly factor BamB/tetratricopeptide (TPR) repeat protein